MDKRENLTNFLADGVKDGVFPGVQLAFLTGNNQNRDVNLVCCGHEDLSKKNKITNDTLFDLASLTKLFIACVALRFIDRGVIGFEDRLGKYLNVNKNHFVCNATILQLLAHEAGFAAWAPLYEFAKGKESISGWEQALAVNPKYKPGEKCEYSDLGYIVLGRILENISGFSLDILVKREITGPLGLNNIFFLNPSSPVPERIACTSTSLARLTVKKGQVHDDNARFMGGMAGHAGLFGSASDVAIFGHAILQSIFNNSWLSKDILKLAVQRRPSGRGLGFDLKSLENSSAGKLLGPLTFGHLGFTGTSLWIDPEKQISIALLTNRVCQDSSNNTIGEFRPAVHDLVVDCL